MEPCMICGEGFLTENISKNSVSYRRVHTDIPFRYSVCDECGSEIALPEQINRNVEEMILFRMYVDSILSR